MAAKSLTKGEIKDIEKMMVSHYKLDAIISKKKYMKTLIFRAIFID